MEHFKRIVIFGVGLIGGSFALALKQAGAVGEVVGVGRRRATLERAQSLGIIDRIGDASSVAGADLVLLIKPQFEVGRQSLSANGIVNFGSQLPAVAQGGLISIYALNEYPSVFGGAAGLSTHWIGIHQPNSHIPLSAYIYLRDKLANPQTHKIYQDHGTTELDANYAIYQVFVKQIMRDKGYQETSPAPNFMTKVYEGTGHNELAWAQRLTKPLQFLFQNK